MKFLAWIGHFLRISDFHLYLCKKSPETQKWTLNGLVGWIYDNYTANVYSHFTVTLGLKALEITLK